MIPQVDIEFAKLVYWGNKNLTQREKDLIYIFENFQRAYLSMKEIENGKMPTKFYNEQMLKVVECIERQKVPIHI